MQEIKKIFAMFLVSFVTYLMLCAMTEMYESVQKPPDLQLA